LGGFIYPEKGWNYLTLLIYLLLNLYKINLR